MTDLVPDLRPHTAGPDLADLVRRALLETTQRLRAAALALRGDDRRRQQALDRWFAGFAAAVRGHLELVEVAVLPRLTVAGAIDEATLDAVAADHTWADHLLGELGDALGVLSFGLGEPERWVRRLATIADELHVVLEAILARQSRRLMPLLDEHLEPTARRQLDRELLRDVTVNRAPFSLSWLCELLDDDELAFVLGAASGASRLAYRSRRRAYRRSAAAAFPDTAG
jgi:hypothetical protein